ncbi:MAG: hypothetical protein E6K54_07415 [Gammaproteobacteria bacterium]|nr:MAG: hypothetical protein E6K54_07415 [Gammaproteobacteria bacterium]
MIKDIVDGLTIKVRENMSKLFQNPTIPANYSLSEESIELENELIVLEKKINLVNDLLAKVNDQESIYKFKKQKEEFENEKKNINSALTKINYLKGSIKDFILFFIFIRRFYTLAILKQNFEAPNKKNSTKLINKLKIEEEDLYNEYIDGDCFSKVLIAFDFERYQSYFKEYAKKFFENIQYFSDPYINTLLKLKAIFSECSYFTADNFNLTLFNFFLSQNIPSNIALPDSNYELVALRCFFFYEFLLEFLKFKPVATHFEDLKKAIILDIAVVDYKANSRNTLISSLNTLEKSLQKLDYKYSNFLSRKRLEDNGADVNHALGFCKVLENEIDIINKKTRTIIESKYLKLEKMRRLLAIIVNEVHLPKFLEVFNSKIGNDFSLNTVGNPDIIKTNKEALNFLFHGLCRDEFYSPLNEKTSLFIKGVTEIYSKDDISILDCTEREDLIEFSFYYLFSLLYPGFNASLSEFNTKLAYTDMVTFNVFLNLKFQSLDILETKRKIEIKKFIEKDFKNIVAYNQYKKNVLEEIKLNLETIQDLNHSLSEIKALETSLIPKLNDSSVLMPEKNLIFDSLKSLEKKQKICEAEYQKIEKHKFNNKPKFKPKKKEINKSELYEKLEIENRSIEDLTETLSCLTQNLSESLKQIKETTQDINRFRQKISSALGKLSSSMQKFLSGLSAFENAKKIRDLENLSLPKLLEKAERLVNNKNLLGQEDFKTKLAELHELHNNPNFSIDFLINLIIEKYRKCNNEAKNILIKLSSAFTNDSNISQFFPKLPKKQESQIYGKLTKEYIFLKEQANGLEKLFSLLKCETDTRILKLCAISVEAEDYQRRFKILDKKIKEQSDKNEKKTEEKNKEVFFKSLPLIRKDEEKNSIEVLSEKFNLGIEKSLPSTNAHINNSREHNLLTEILKSTDECSKIKARFEEEYTNKERAKADLKTITSNSRYSFLMSRIDPFNVNGLTNVKTTDNNQSQISCLTVPAALPVDSIEATYNNHSQPGSAAYLTSAPIMFYSAPPTIVVDTYHLENRTVFYPI